MDVLEQITVEAATEHPFFVRAKGWCSSCPQRTMRRYGLPCNQLAVGDCCIALSQLVQPPPAVVPADPRPTSHDDDAPLDFSTGTDPSRPGVIRSPAGSSRCGGHRSSSESVADSVASSTAA